MSNLMLDYIKSQPALWLEMLDNRKAITEGFVSAFDNKPVKRIILIGSGSSNGAARMAAEFFNRSLGVEATPIEPTRVAPLLDILDPSQTLVLALSQSGKSASTLQAAIEAKAKNFAVAGVTADPASPIAKQLKNHLLIPCGEELIGPKTRGMTATVLTLYLAGLALWKKDDSLIQDLRSSFNLASQNIEASESWCETNSFALASRNTFYLIAEGTDLPIAQEGALKLLETIYTPVHYYEFEEFLHGVHCSVSDLTTLILISDSNGDRERMKKLDNFAKTHSSAGFFISTGTPSHLDNELFIQTSGNELTRPFETLLPFQVMSALISKKKGIDCSKSPFPNFGSDYKTKI
ncbi:MAG: SIS domain-containing protein [Clostridiales bacterium]|nr:SIS domain-containing protein [Clostridiales bacterium]